MTLTWNGTTQSPVTFTPDGSGTQVVAVQVDSPVTATGEYSWSVAYDLVFHSGSQTGTVSGDSSVVVQDSSSQPDPYGAGWGIASVDQLDTKISGGILWVYGTGDSEFFASAGSGAYTSPTGNYGSLTQVGGGYTYTANGSIKEQFDSNGMLTSAVTMDNLTRTYAYDGKDRLTQMGQLATGGE